MSRKDVEEVIAILRALQPLAVKSAVTHGFSEQHRGNLITMMGALRSSLDSGSLQPDVEFWSLAGEFERELCLSAASPALRDALEDAMLHSPVPWEVDRQAWVHNQSQLLDAILSVDALLAEELCLANLELRFAAAMSLSSRG